MVLAGEGGSVGTGLKKVDDPFIEEYLRELWERTGTLRPERAGRPAPSSTSPSKAKRR